MVNSLIKKIGVSDGILNGSSLGINIVNTMLLVTHFQDSALVLFSGFTFLFCAVLELPISYWADRNGVRLSLRYAYISSIIWVLSIITANYIALNKIEFLYYPSIFFYSISCALSNAFYKGTFQTAYLDWYNKHSKSEDSNLFVNSFPYSVKWKYAIPTLMLLSTILLRLFSDHSVSLILVLLFITVILRFYTTYRDLDLSNTSGDKIPPEKKLTISRLVESTANTRPETGAYAYSVITRNFVQAVLIAKCCIFIGPLSSVSTWITGIFVALGINYLNLFISAVIFSKLKSWENIGEIRWYATLGLTVLSSVCLGMFLIFENNYIRISVVVIFCFFALTLADLLKYEIESNVKQFVKTDYRASWFGAGNLLSHLCYAFIAGIIWLIGHHELDVHLILTFIAVFGCILLMTSSSHLRSSSPLKRSVSLQNHLISKYLFFLIPTGFFLSSLFLFYWIAIKLI